MDRVASIRRTPRAKRHLSTAFLCLNIPIVHKYTAHRVVSVSVPEQQTPLFYCRRIDNL